MCWWTRSAAYENHRAAVAASHSNAFYYVFQPTLCTQNHCNNDRRISLQRLPLQTLLHRTIVDGKQYCCDARGPSTGTNLILIREDHLGTPCVIPGRLPSRASTCSTHQSSIRQKCRRPSPAHSWNDPESHMGFSHEVPCHARLPFCQDRSSTCADRDSASCLPMPSLCLAKLLFDQSASLKSRVE